MASSQQATSPADTNRDDIPSDAPSEGLTIDVAGSIEEVVTAWRLVYKSYIRAGLIHPNTARIHTVKQAIGLNTAVICGRLGGLTISTLTSYLDGPDGLPLDSTYPDELRALRDQGKVLLELGLFADRREHLHRSVEAMLELMRFGTYFGVHVGATHGIIGVHPRHVAFYTRLLAFDVIGPERTYSVVNERPVVLLQLDWHTKTGLAKPPRGLAHFIRNPVPGEVFERRARMDAESVADTAIERYLQVNPGAEQAA